MKGAAVDRFLSGGLSLAWRGVSDFVWSPWFVRAVGSILRLLPARTYRVSYKGSYLYATSPDRFLALLLWKHRVLEAYELRVAEGLIRPGMHILDIGANVGFHSLEFARWTGPTGRVDAFEPEPRNHAMLSRNIAASGLENVNAFAMAISDSVGQTDMYLSPAHSGDHRIVESGDHRGSIRVDTCTVDHLYAGTDRCVDFVKIDAQGAEYMVLAGMRQGFQKNPAIVAMVEFCPSLVGKSGHSADEFVSLLRALNRRVRIIDHTRQECVDCDLETLRRRATVERQLDLLLT